VENIIENIRKVALERFKETDLEDCFILDIVIKDKKVEVYVDTDSGIKFWQCQKLSRAVEEYLDESQALGEAYTLEVSSPGIDVPLKLFRQYPRNIGRNLDLTLLEGKEMTGKLMEINGEELTMRVQGAKKGMFKTAIVPFDNIVKALVQVSFKKKKK